MYAMRKVKFGILYSTIGQMQELISRVYGLGEPVIIMPGFPNYRIDVLLVPDKVGIDPRSEALKHGTYEAFPLQPVCPSILWLREHIQQYIAREVYVVGIGEGAIPLWEYLEEKIALTKEGKSFEFLYGEKSKIPKENVGQFNGIGIDYFFYNQLGGCKTTSTGLNNMLLGIRNSILEEVEQIKKTGDEAEESFIL